MIKPYNWDVVSEQEKVELLKKRIWITKIKATYKINKLGHEWKERFAFFLLHYWEGCVDYHVLALGCGNKSVVEWVREENRKQWKQIGIKNQIIHKAIEKVCFYGKKTTMIYLNKGGTLSN